MDQEPLLDYKKLEVRKVRSADEDIIALLKSTVLGSEGGMRYTMLNTPERIRSYGDGLSFLALYKRNSLKGVIGLCRRIPSNRGTRYVSSYLRYLPIQSAFQVENGRIDTHLLQTASSKRFCHCSVILSIPPEAMNREAARASPMLTLRAVMRDRAT